jgi:O-antigen ligase
MLIAAVLSLSAGAIFLGLPAAIVAVLLLARGRQVIGPVLALAGVTAVGLLLALRSARFARLLDFSSGTNFVRLRVWHSALNMLRDHPLQGIGLDQFLYAFRGAYISPDAWREQNLSHPHNIVLDFWLRLSVIGIVLLIWMQILFWRNARRLYRYFAGHDALYFALVVGLMGSMVNLLTHGLVDNSVFVNDLAYVFMLLLALVNLPTNARAAGA